MVCIPALAGLSVYTPAFVEIIVAVVAPVISTIAPLIGSFVAMSKIFPLSCVVVFEGSMITLAFLNEFTKLGYVGLNATINLSNWSLRIASMSFISMPMFFVNVALTDFAVLGFGTEVL